MRHQVSVDVEAPLERVWALMMDVERWPEWTASMRSVRREDEGPLQVGSRVTIRQPKLPPATWRVTAIDVDGDDRRAFSWEAGAPGMRSVASHEVVARDGGRSAVTLSVQTSGAIGRLLWPLLGGITRRYVATEAEGLKSRAEREEASRSA